MIERQCCELGRNVGIAKGDAFLTHTGDWLTDADVTAAPAEANEVAFTVTGKALSVIPGKTFTVSQTAHGTVERLTPVD